MPRNPHLGSAASEGRRPRVLLVTHYFPPEVGAPQARLGEFASYWAAAGADVTVLTGMPNYPTGVIPPQYRGATLRVEHTDGYRLVRTWLWATTAGGLLPKTLSQISFAVSAVLLGARRAGAADVVVVSSGPFFPIASAWLLARTKRARLVVEVRDLWPAIFVDLGVLRNKFVIAMLERFELAAYRAADAVVTVTEGFRADIVRRGIRRNKVIVIHNGVDVASFQPRDARPEARRRLGAADGQTLVLYLGTHGISQGLESVIDAAAELRNENMSIALVGEGAVKERLRERVARLGLSNVSMLGNVGRHEVPDLLAAADICLVPLRDVPLFSTFVPSKMFELLAAGKAVIGAVRGEAAQILTDAGATVVAPEDPVELAAAIRKLAADPAARAEAGRIGREHVAANYDRPVLADRYLTLLRSLMETGRPA
ncbi:glycosyltransferase WbuB [Parafrankia colletiae]|uniref:Glycosyltransferase WbuB n=1 Tax=Parafrankia colletiae TaxID=573497 RepID=A0A1S1RJN6_9ACTN|nr:glycosyltransferase family 4 protein [Parafrankia colletiae]MCK9903286.1 glycosyltransferase family 4 protein [Frankia sp. Cpl3]OHV46257.1 glycosyltransferase WbuB [Parafrankia colletiae]